MCYVKKNILCCKHHNQSAFTATSAVFFAKVKQEHFGGSCYSVMLGLSDIKRGPINAPHFCILLLAAKLPTSMQFVTSVIAQAYFHFSRKIVKYMSSLVYKVHIFREGHKNLRNLRLTFDWHYIRQK